MGERLDVVIRPEVGLSDDQHFRAGENTFGVTVTSTAFLGDHYLYELDLAGVHLTVTNPALFTSSELSAHMLSVAGCAEELD